METEETPESPKPGTFDYATFERGALEQLKSGKALERKDGILAPLIKRLVEAGLEGELDIHLWVCLRKCVSRESHHKDGGQGNSLPTSGNERIPIFL